MSTRGRVVAGAVLMAAALGALAPAAQGRSLGSVAVPDGATEVECDIAPGPTVGHQVLEAGTSWTVPNRGLLTSWSTNVRSWVPGASASLVLMRAAGQELRIVALDTPSFPTPLPMSGVATFRPARPIVVEPGDRLGNSGTSGAICGWEGETIPAALRAEVWSAEGQVTPGARVIPAYRTSSPSHLNLAAEVLESTDVRVAAAAGPADVVAGGLAQLSATVFNPGPAATPVTVTDTVPDGLRIETAVAGGGACTVAGQQVTCEIPSLAPGASAPLVVLVTPAAPGAYVNAVAAEPALDFAPADNAASATLTVAAPPQQRRGDEERRGEERRGGEEPAPRCVVPGLARTPLPVARRLLRQLDCKPGKVTRARSKKVPRGAVIATRPGRGRYRAGTSVRIVVSAGKPPRRAASRARARR